MRILAMNGSSGDGRAALLIRGRDGLHCVCEADQPGRGGAERLAGAVRRMLLQTGWDAGSLGLVAAVTGPGSFTGLRATLALAQGMALGADLPLHGVSLGEALRRTVHAKQRQDAPALPVWCASVARRDRLFLDRGDGAGSEAFMLDAVPVPDRPVLLAGDASDLLAQRIERAGGVAHLSAVAQPDILAIAACAVDQLEGRVPRQPALPLYVDPPEARRPAAGLRPQPV